MIFQSMRFCNATDKVCHKFSIKIAILTFYTYCHLSKYDVSSYKFLTNKIQTQASIFFLMIYLPIVSCKTLLPLKQFFTIQLHTSTYLIFFQLCIQFWQRQTKCENSSLVLWVIHKLRLQQEWVGGFRKCQLYLISLLSKTVNQGGSKRAKFCRRSM